VGSSHALKSKSPPAVTGLRLWATFLVVFVVLLVALALAVDLVLALEVDLALAFGLDLALALALGLDVVLALLPLADFVAILLSPNE
jgi:hypothetical protein